MSDEHKPLSAEAIAALDRLRESCPELWAYFRLLGKAVLLYHEDSARAFERVEFARQVISGFPQLVNAAEALECAESYLSSFLAEKRDNRQEKTCPTP